MLFKEPAKDVLAFCFRRSRVLRRLAAFGTAQAENDRLLNLIRSFRVDSILDVGANRGQFANDLRRSGFNDIIHSFEPLRGCFTHMEAAAKEYPQWWVHNFALGDEPGRRVIHVADNEGLSSSFLDEIDLDYGYHVHFTGREEVVVKRLDDVVDGLELGSKCLLKLDAQGYEPRIIAGSSRFISARRPIVFLESSLFPNYKGERLFQDVHELMSSFDYRLVLVRKQIGDSRVDLQADFAFLHAGDFNRLLDELRSESKLTQSGSFDRSVARAAESVFAVRPAPA